MPFDLDPTVDRWILTALVALGGYLIAVLGRRAVHRTTDDPQQRYNAARLIRFSVWLAAALALVLIWRPLGGSLGPALGLATAGLAFAMQEVIGAIAGWFNITFGDIFDVGDRIEMAGVHGDVIDVSLLKTRIMEIGNPDGSSWVRGRQYTGRVVAVSNKSSFTSPVFNYSSYFDYIWEELEVTIPHHEDWPAAVRILEEEADDLSASTGAQSAMDEVRTRFPVPATEVEPRVFARSDETYIRLAVRFVVPIRSARLVKDDMTRRAQTRLEEAGIEVISTDVIQQARDEWTPVTAGEADRS